MAKVELLKELRTWFASVPESKIDMGDWKSGHINPVGENVDHSCLTAGCLWGWGAVYKPFREAGVRWCDGLVPEYKEYVGYSAFSVFFEVPYDTAEFLCDPVRYKGIPTKADVLKRLDEVIAKYGKESVVYEP